MNEGHGFLSAEEAVSLLIHHAMCLYVFLEDATLSDLWLLCPCHLLF